MGEAVEAGVEADGGVAEAYLVAVDEEGGLIDEVLVEVGAVAAFEVADEVALVGSLDFAVDAAGESVVDDDGVVGGASDGDAFVIGDDAAGWFGIVDIENGHGRLFHGRCRGSEPVPDGGQGHDAKKVSLCQ